MSTSIILGGQNAFTRTVSEDKDRKYIFFNYEEEAYLYHLDHPEDIDSYILDSEHLTGPDLSRTVKHITFLNDLARIFILGNPNLPPEENQFGKTIRICSTAKDIADGLKSISGDHRQYSRVRWPVAVIFWKEENALEKFKGIVVSISSGGCLIKSDKIIEERTPLVMTIIFRNFNFLAEGIVVRKESGRFAVRMKNISSQTQKIIQKIINERILVKLKEIN